MYPLEDVVGRIFFAMNEDALIESLTLVIAEVSGQKPEHVEGLLRQIVRELTEGLEDGASALEEERIRQILTERLLKGLAGNH